MLKDLIKERRSIRQYKENSVDVELVKDLLKYSLMGPSYKSARPVEFLVVTDKEILEKLSNVGSFSTKYIAEVPMAIVILANTETTTTWVEESAISAAYFQLLAQEEGLNTCWVNLKEGEASNGEEIQAYLKSFLNFPKNLKAVCMIPVGYGNERVRKRKDFEVDEKIHYNTF
ncbi:nitroreductase family protein [Peptoniphilus indolicus]|uniref:Nitroreductase n=2 Tax=Peptoniphilus indolicus TaxID=33030 RepID=G4D145_9FIRM|nr:nitroreductase family protein [Peptoniphilus indolicus]EGY80722.1 nitroreductase [Peptoniphilus indolicus ATCC 29427]SUB74828.1 NADH dehydrogenase [Peptoniphilus indolicus]